MKVKRKAGQNQPLMSKLETGGLGGAFKPASRPAYDKNAQLYREINDGLGKAMKFGISFFEGMMDEVFDVKIGSHQRKTRTVKRKFGKAGRF
jgi:hypothetical protein